MQPHNTSSMLTSKLGGAAWRCMACGLGTLKHNVWAALTSPAAGVAAGLCTDHEGSGDWYCKREQHW
jgi:hypothetical protein